MYIKKKFKKSFEVFLKKNLEEISSEELEVALYGMEVFYSLFIKFLVFLALSVLLKCYEEFLIVYLLLSILRSTSFGFHADSEISCYLISFIIIFGTIYISNNYIFDMLFKGITCILSFFTTLLYAPADTEKRPLLNKNTRSILKVCSCITVIFFSFISLVNIGFMSTSIICLLIINSVNISPILYKIFKRRYRNYEYY